MGGTASTSSGAVASAVLAAALLLLAFAALVSVLAVLAGTSTCSALGAESAPTADARQGIPADYLATYRDAGRDYDVPWQILAGIGWKESDHGRSPASGVRSGVNSFGCCAGPMQFNLRDGPPSTWDRYGVDGDHDGSTDVYDREDAIASAANYLHELLRRASGDLGQAILGYNHSQSYVDEVLARARRYAGESADELTAAAADPGAVDCSDDELGVLAGPIDLGHARRLTTPRAFRRLPAWAMADDRPPQLVDARIHANVLWILRRYRLRVTAARESGHETHGDGTAIDLVPADGTTQPVWDSSAGRVARDLGWTPDCGRSGSRPACPLALAIQFIGYDGYTNHGSPRTCSGGCPAHLHISWASGCYGSSALRPPCPWVTAFPAPPPDGALASIAQQELNS